MTAISGVCAEQFLQVRDTFEENFAYRGELGAGLAVVHDDEVVVDLVGGVADAATGAPWTANTLVTIFSQTKGIVATCVHRLREQGRLDIDMPVAELWPEFGRHGKSAITVRHLLTHRAGLPAFRDPITVEDTFVPGLAAARLADQEPEWEPGTRHGYHSMTFGFLIDEIVLRATGSRLGTVLREEFADPMGLDVWIGLPPEEHHRMALVTTSDDVPAPSPWMQAFMKERATARAAARADKSSLVYRLMTRPYISADLAAFNSPQMWAASWPSGNGVADARSVARLYGALACDESLSAATLDEATREHSAGPDVTLGGVTTRFGLGYSLSQPLVTYGSDTGFGHSGLGGSLAFADRTARVGFAYVMNRPSRSSWPDDRATALTAAVYGALGFR